MRTSGLLLLALVLPAQTPTSDLANVRMVTADTPRDVQIALARSAGPSSVTAAATIYILGPKGLVEAQHGTNGFTCLVDRDRPDVIAPECYDSAGKPLIDALLFVEAERAKGVPEAQIQATVTDRRRKGEFGPPTRSGIVYMLSDYNYLFDPEAKEMIHFPGHLMFYAPYLTATDVGSGPGAPFLTRPGQPDNMMVVIPAPSHQH